MVAVDIANLALSYLGDSATVASLDPPEGSAQAQHCARFYPVALSAMLDAHQWNFVTKRVALALIANYNPPDGRWRYAYALPSDVANVISVLPKSLYCRASGSLAAMDEIAFAFAIAQYWGYWPLEWERDAARDFEIEIVNGQQAIVTNVCDAVARYSSTTVQPGMFSALFTDALAWKLASMLAGPILKGDAGMKQAAMCLGMYGKIMAQAMESDANQKHGNRQPVPSNILARL